MGPVQAVWRASREREELARGKGGLRQERRFQNVREALHREYARCTQQYTYLRDERGRSAPFQPSRTHPSRVVSSTKPRTTASIVRSCHTSCNVAAVRVCRTSCRPGETAEIVQQWADSKNQLETRLPVRRSPARCTASGATLLRPPPSPRIAPLASRGRRFAQRSASCPRPPRPRPLATSRSLAHLGGVAKPVGATQ